MSELTCFKAYDVRGQLGTELNEDIAYRIGRAYGEFLKPRTIVVGGDVRLTSEELKLAFSNGLRDTGADVLDIGLSGTEEIYFATSHLGVDGGVEVTASHNPMDYNGMKASCGEELCTYDQLCPGGEPYTSPVGGQQADHDMWAPILPGPGEGTQNWVQVGTRASGGVALHTAV